MLRGVKNPLATLRKSRCSGGSISMMVRICASGLGPVWRSASCLWLRKAIPSALLNTLGRLEMRVMSACRVIA